MILLANIGILPAFYLRNMFLFLMLKWNKKNVYKGRLMLVFSVGYEEKEKGQTLNFEDLSSVAPELGLEPRTL